jgi:bifunctional UDP-N-acetylglucosamine pyrophosphorylase / glucosamine-1-phosphate N-acetyltransferase
MATNRIAVILAAGMGKRMNSTLPKVLCPAKGRPLVDYVLDVLDKLDVQKQIVVVGYRADDVKAALAPRKRVEFALQTEQLGTGHAVMMAKEQLAGHEGPVLVLAGDSPMTQVSSLQALFSEYEAKFDANRPACILGTLKKEDPKGLGRIVRDAGGEFEQIVEEKDATEAQRQITEVNMSTYLFHGPDLLWALGQLTNQNQQKEYYLTDCPGILKRAGKIVKATPVLKPCEALSVNTPDELRLVEIEMERLAY